MKKAIIISLSLIAFSCSKTYNCTTTVTTQSDYVNSVSSTETEFKGIKEEMKQYELDNTRTLDLYPSGTLTQVTECR